MFPGFPQQRRFSELSEKEILALAISAEEEDGRIYATYADTLRAEYPQSAALFDGMAAEEDEHRRRLIDVFRRRFGESIPLVRRDDVAGFYRRRPVWLLKNLSVERIRSEAASMEAEARNFYFKAARLTGDAGTRKLLGDLAAAEGEHIRAAEG